MFHQIYFLYITFGYMYIINNVSSDLFLNITFGNMYMITNVSSENWITQFDIGKDKRGKKLLREQNYEGGIIGFICYLNVNLKEL